MVWVVSALAGQGASPAGERCEDDSVVVFLTGNGLGTLQPCGCSGGQLGGLDRRAIILNSVDPSKRLIVDTGTFVEGYGEQDMIKFNIIVQALDLLNYDIVNLSDNDIEIADNLGLSNSLGMKFDYMTAGADDVNMPAKFTRQLSLKEKTVAVTVASFDPQTGPVEQIRRLFERPACLQSANILILNYCDAGLIKAIADMGLVDCVVCPPEGDEAAVVSSEDAGPLVVSVGRLGKYVGKLQIREGKDNKLKFGYSAVPVSEDLAQEEALVELYKVYQQLVKEADLLQGHPRWSLANGLRYTGSESCKSCHKYEYEKWSTKAHASAYATLERVGSQYDPECVVCHVVGMDYYSGFVSEQTTGHLKNVGCENCHGPGSMHKESYGKVKTSEPFSDCMDCHTPEHSGEFAGNEEHYLKKIVHWREPNNNSAVKISGGQKD